ncbi:MAG: hypothetical protein J0L92_02455 [Deltaproteobacteria bacterium]|nr:hypothetical protein [Deltaproteobacteria bacterium]
MTPMVKTQVYLEEKDLRALHRIAKSSKRTVASLVREAVERTWLTPERRGPVAVWSGPVRATAADHDSIYDEA